VTTPLPTPRPLSKADRENFNTLKQACDQDDLALVSAIRKSDNAPVALVCAIQRNNDDTFTPIPLAVMIEGNPFEDFYDPTIFTPTP